MKVRVTLELEISDLPEEVRAEMADVINFAKDGEESEDLDAVPGIEDIDADDLASMVGHTLKDFFQDYESQQELWAGTDFYGYVSSAELVESVVE